MASWASEKTDSYFGKKKEKLSQCGIALTNS
jgi:hypothetical protein